MTTHRLPVPGRQYLKPAAITLGALAVAFTAWEAALFVWPGKLTAVAVAFPLTAVILAIAGWASDRLSGDAPLVDCLGVYAAKLKAGKLRGPVNAAALCSACPSDTYCPKLARPWYLSEGEAARAPQDPRAHSAVPAAARPGEAVTPVHRLSAGVTAWQAALDAAQKYEGQLWHLRSGQFPACDQPWASDSGILAAKDRGRAG